jgi:cation diffusion facilitator CzcD-associated flavoprotein CzcO
VLVVGGGNSGFQIAEELAATRQVDLSIGDRTPMLPQRLAGKDLFSWLTRLGLLRVTVDSRLGRRASRREFIIGINKRRLRKAGVRFRPRLVEADGRTVRFADGSTLHGVGAVVWATGYRSDYTWIHTQRRFSTGGWYTDAASSRSRACLPGIVLAAHPRLSPARLRQRRCRIPRRPDLRPPSRDAPAEAGIARQPSS